MVNSVLLFFLFAGLLVCAFISSRRLMFALLLIGGFPYTLLMPKASIMGMAPQAWFLFVMIVVVMAAFLIRFDVFLKLSVRYSGFTLFLLFALFSLAWGTDLNSSFRMLLKLAGPFLFFLAMQTFLETEEDLGTACRMMFLCCLAVLGLAIIHKLTGGALFLEVHRDEPLTFTYLTAPHMSPANFSFLIGSGALLALGKFFHTGQKKFLALNLLLSVAVMLAFVRISMAGTVLGSAIIIFLLARSTALKVLFPVVMVVLFVTAFFTIDSFKARMFKSSTVSLSTLTSTKVNKLDEVVSTTGRSELWRKASERFFEKSPIIGAGLGAVDYWLRHGTRLHSEVLHLLCDLGALGLALYLCGVGQIVATLLWTYFRSDAPLVRTHAAIALGAFTLYLCTLMTDNSLSYVTEFGFYVFSLGAWTLVAQRIALPGATESPEEDESAAWGKEPAEFFCRRT